MELNAPRRVVEEALGDAVVQAIDGFVFRDIEDAASAAAVFDFVSDPDVRAQLGTALRGVRWQQKAGLVLARYVAHPAHAAQVRSQMIEYGAVAETSLREMVRQKGVSKLPSTFKGIVDRAESEGILTKDGAAAAHRLREARNCVHLYLSSRSPRAQREGRAAWREFILVVNECRAATGLSVWHPGRPV